jgi:DNA-binding CsgD family transcriptional regulator
MTRLIFLPDDDSPIVIFDSKLNLSELLQQISLPEITTEQWNILQHGAWTLAAPCSETAPRLSPRQRQVLEGLANGLTTKQMSIRLHITPRMITFHITALKVRLNAQSRAEIIAHARKFDLL